MAHLPPNPGPDGDTGDDTDMPPSDADTTGTPRWVKVGGIIAVVVILLFVILLLIDSGQHGPGRHMPSGGDPTPPVQRP